MVEVSDRWDVGEYEYFNDDPKFIADLLSNNWDTFPLEKPVIAYTPEQWMTSAKYAFIYVYQVSRYNSVSSTDYRTIQRTSFVAIRLSCPNRNSFFTYMDHIQKLIFAHRRIGQKRLHGYTYLEIINDRVVNDLSGWYTGTMDVKLTSYNYPVESDGFGLDKCCDCEDGTL